ncbi:MAG: NAD(P)/FAD-dependent oxidoreductase [Bryobacterales bacterium]|nr:NAD(P)/FAD-dependent oxidoreductase [Bryobacterales bacterium]
MDRVFDGIILGTGHNALVLQAYLARCGLRVLSLERNPVAGGGLATEDDPLLPGFRHNTHSFFHRALTAMPWYRDLDLERQGARYIEPELNVAMILKDGRALEWWTDLERTAESAAEFSVKDAQTLRRWAEEFRPVVQRALTVEAQAPPLDPVRRRELLSQSAAGRRLLEVSALSPLEFVEREFESDVVRAGMLFFNGLREVDLRQKGFGHSIPSLLASPRKAQMCVGGSAELARALIRDIEAHGGEVRTDARIESILVRNGRAVGVQLAAGMRVEAKAFVASGLNPRQTFLDLISADSISAAVREQARGFQYNVLAPLFTLNAALAEPPRYRAAARKPGLNRAFMVILGLESLAQFSEIVAAHEQGRVPPPVLWGACPTLFDPTQAPEGRHTAFMWVKTPYHLDLEARKHGEALLNLWAEFAPNLANGAVLNWFARAPREIAVRLPNMRYGDLLVGSFANGQVGYNRPFRGSGRYRTPVGGLYLCGGSTHPGGNITGLCGYNAASVIAADLGLPVWWNPPDVEAALQSL